MPRRGLRAADPAGAVEGRRAHAGYRPLRSAVTLALYHGLLALGMVVLGPVLAWRLAKRPMLRRTVRARLAPVAFERSGRDVVWLHGVSVGEVKGLATLVAAIERSHPALEVVVSATTASGFDLARRLYPGRRVIHYPLDLATLPGRALDAVRPRCVLLMELEIWPTFLAAAARRAVPVAVVNGRISERSFRGYRLVRPLLPQFDLVERYCVQNEVYRDRLLALGVAPERISVTGNVKYDGVLLGAEPPGAARLRRWLAADGREVLVCGSTHGREEEWLADAFAEVVARRGRPMRLVLVPRHPERAEAVCEALGARGQRTVRWSRCSESLEPLEDDRIVVVDTIGHLESFYGACDVAFVGGSLVPHGGQNMLEPAALGKAVLFGPHTANFRNDVELLLADAAAIRVEDRTTLAAELVRVLDDAALRRGLGERAVSLIRRNQGAAERTRKLLEPLFT